MPPGLFQQACGMIVPFLRSILPTLQREIAHNLLELLSWQDPESFAFQQTALRLALIGSDLQNRPCLLNEIEGEKGQFSLLNRRHHKKGFWEKHKVAILVGIGIVALVTTVAIVTLCTGGAGAGAVAATGGSLLQAGLNDEKKKNQKSRGIPQAASPPASNEVAPSSCGKPFDLDGATPGSLPINPEESNNSLFPIGHQWIPKDPFGLFPDQVPPHLALPSTHPLLDSLPPIETNHEPPLFVFDPEYGPKSVDPQKNLEVPVTFGEIARQAGSGAAHKLWEDISDLAFIAPQFLEEIREIGDRILPENFIAPDQRITQSPQENYDQLVIAGHEAIDQIFGTDRAELYTPELKEARNFFTIGMLPIPAQLEKQISDWLGEGTHLMRNKAGDPVFLSKDGLRRIRFDFNNPHGDKLHLHIEHKIGGKWEDASSQHRIYPRNE